MSAKWKWPAAGLCLLFLACCVLIGGTAFAQFPQIPVAAPPCPSPSGPPRVIVIRTQTSESKKSAAPADTEPAAPSEELPPVPAPKKTQSEAPLSVSPAFYPKAANPAPKKPAVKEEKNSPPSIPSAPPDSQSKPAPKPDIVPPIPSVPALPKGDNADAPKKNKDLVPVPPLPDKEKTKERTGKKKSPALVIPVTGEEEAPPKHAEKTPAEPKRIEIVEPKNAAKWIVKVEVAEGLTHLQAQSKNAKFQVSCQNLKMQSPNGEIQAEGKVKVAAGAMEVQCDRLVISWQNDWVQMEGAIRLLTEKDSQRYELTGDQLRLKLTTLTSKNASRAAQSEIQRISYLPPGLSNNADTSASPARPAESGGRFYPPRD